MGTKEALNIIVVMVVAGIVKFDLGQLFGILYRKLWNVTLTAKPLDWRLTVG